MATHNRKNPNKLAAWLGVAAVVSLGAWLWLERRRPLRRANENRLTRDVRNLAVAVCGAVVTNLTESPLALRMARCVETRRLGLLKQFALPRVMETVAACVLLDYTLYVWHYLTHKVPLLWRCHVVHHADLDLSVTTALRFHFAELLLSVPFRLVQVRLLGVSPPAFTLWQRLLFLSVMFHHSNVGLPIDWERRLNRFIVTPRMHGIHHSIVREETDSNWSSGLTVWDWLHGTLRRDVPQQAVTIGVPAYRAPEQVTFAKITAMPFVAQPDSWQLLEGEGRQPRLPSQDFSR
ncbi:MAG TPA: sterol desaturase family protein [Blastocatellia bacterium]|nr:sterol desaturase family protein [Blastocatellia bacterium]HMV86666.1 sterol desaturase family protein [Blastocatellia bacterium]HMX24122.1 sterol desaturase family protein [Blastocatellia bacterium]HMY70528.1 sterol desaturase family protein [Blastocatellia bacterium]HMZ21278.1 sterol desaturase family protein [Blastocatellia bacterium]